MLRTRRDDTQIVRLRQLARQAVGRVLERAHFVLLSMQGHSPAKIGELMGYDTATVRYWLKAYRDRSLAGLYDAPRSGRPPREKHLTAIVQTQAGQPPPNYAYLQACWTVALLELVYLPTYTGHRFNPVEKVWRALKDHIAANRSFRTLAELDRAIRRYFATFTCGDALRLTNSDVTRAAQAATPKSAENLPRAA